MMFSVECSLFRRIWSVNDAVISRRSEVLCTAVMCCSPAVLVEFQALCASGVGFSADGKGKSDIMLHVWSCRQ